MDEITYPPVFFVSYARADAKYEPDRKDLEKFIEDLSASVARKVPTPLKGVRFFDTSSIEAGEVWSTELAEALKQCKVGVVLYTPTYFTRKWCGREFQVFLNRLRAVNGPSGIVPVLWMKCPALPACAETFQHWDNSFPAEYAQVGMQQLLKLQAVYPGKYDMAIDALSYRIVAAKEAQSLMPLESLDSDEIPSAWEQAVAADPLSHTRGSISKTCFVFLSQKGWDWQPYPDPRPEIGALAQRISGELGLRYEEIPCDKNLTKRLEETNQSKVPTVLFGDPSSLLDPKYARPLEEYDKQFLLNCGMLVPWDEASKIAGDREPRWMQIQVQLCRQKIESPPPHHEWRSIFSRRDLELKTRTTIEQIRSRLMKQIMVEADAGDTTVVRKAEDLAIWGPANSIGIPMESPAQLEGPTR